MGTFETFEHTADVGMRVSATTASDLFVTAARGLFALIVENPDAIAPREELEIQLAAEDAETLFVDWLRELIYRAEAEHFLGAVFAVDIDEKTWRLTARLRGERADWTRHEAGNEVKAVTYHGLRVERTPAGWQAEVIFDI